MKITTAKCKICGETFTGTPYDFHQHIMYHKLGIHDRPFGGS